MSQTLSGPLRGRARCQLALLLAALSAPVAFATDLPPGFAESDVLPVDDAWGIRSFDWSPDGVLWVAQDDGIQGNKIWAYRGSDRTLALDFGWFPEGDMGFTTLVVDPDYASNGYVWLFYTKQSPAPATNRVSRFSAVDDTLVDEVVVVESPPVQSGLHYGGCLDFTSDGHLFVALGDDFQWSASAQDPWDLRGKVLRIHRDGSAAEDNPFVETGGGDPRIFSWGLRNPFRCTVQPVTDALFFGDVGSYLFEEINMATLGGNFGWADTEGPDPPGLPGVTYPIYAYPSRLEDGTGGCVIIGDFAEAQDLDPGFEGDFFWADRVRSEIYRAELDASSNFTSLEVFATIDGPHITSLKFGPDGALYYSSGGNVQNIRRIDYVGGANRQPTAVASAAPDSGSAPLTVALDGSQSSDPDEDPLAFDWDLGDGGDVSGVTVNHEYPQGVYEVVLTVDDGQGLTDDSPPIRIVSGNNRPVASITSPTHGTNYNAGQQLTLTGAGTDAEEGTIPCSQVSWQGIFHHNDHTHPFFGPEQGSCSMTVIIPDRGEDEISVWYRFVLSVEDTGVPLDAEGTLEALQEVEVFPNLSQLSFQTLPYPDLTLTLETQPFTAPMTAESVVGLIRKIGAVDGQPRDGHEWSWVSWSDGGEREHEIATPAQSTLYVATFGCDVLSGVDNLIVDRSHTNGRVTLKWDAVVDSCLLGGGESYRVYAASTPRPLTAPGDFPDDPPYTLVTTTDDLSYTYSPPDEHGYFIVVPVGTDLMHGPVGHYGE